MITVMLFSDLQSEVCHAQLSDYKTAVSTEARTWSHPLFAVEPRALLVLSACQVLK